MVRIIMCRFIYFRPKGEIWPLFKADDILKCFADFPQKIGIDISCEFSGKYE